MTSLKYSGSNLYSRYTWWYLCLNHTLDHVQYFQTSQQMVHGQLHHMQTIHTIHQSNEWRGSGGLNEIANASKSISALLMRSSGHLSSRMRCTLAKESQRTLCLSGNMQVSWRGRKPYKRNTRV